MYVICKYHVSIGGCVCDVVCMLLVCYWYVRLLVTYMMYVGRIHPNRTVF